MYARPIQECVYYGDRNGCILTHGVWFCLRIIWVTNTFPLLPRKPLLTSTQKTKTKLFTVTLQLTRFQVFMYTDILYCKYSKFTLYHSGRSFLFSNTWSTWLIPTKKNDVKQVKSFLLFEYEYSS